MDDVTAEVLGLSNELLDFFVRTPKVKSSRNTLRDSVTHPTLSVDTSTSIKATSGSTSTVISNLSLKKKSFH